MNETTSLTIDQLPEWAQTRLLQELDGISEVNRYVIQCPEYSDVEIYTIYVYADLDWIIALKCNNNYENWISSKVFQI
jgi:hypothetical protein